MPDATRRALLIAHGAALMLGVTALFPRFLPLPADQLVALRTALAGLVLLTLALVRRQSWTWLRGTPALWLLLIGLLLGAHWWAFYAAIQAGGVGLAVVLVYSYPVLSLLLESVWWRRWPSSRLLLAGGGVILGVALVTGPLDGTGQASGLTIALALFAALLYALRNLLLSARFAQAPGEALSAAQFVVIALAGAPSLVGGVQLDAAGWGWLLLFGTLFTAIPHLGVVLALQRLPASTVGLITSLEVPYAVLFATLLLGETPTPALLAGGACIVAAAMLASRRA